MASTTPEHSAQFEAMKAREKGAKVRATERMIRKERAARRLGRGQKLIMAATICSHAGVGLLFGSLFKSWIVEAVSALQLLYGLLVVALFIFKRGRWEPNVFARYGGYTIVSGTTSLIGDFFVGWHPGGPGLLLLFAAFVLVWVGLVMRNGARFKLGLVEAEEKAEAAPSHVPGA